MDTLAILLASYTMCCAGAIAVSHVGGEPYRDQPRARAMGLLLLAALAGLQAAHFAWLHLARPWMDSAPYRMALFAVAPSFFLFTQPLLKPAGPPPTRAVAALHFVPAALAGLLSPATARTLAFAIGATYLFWLGRRLCALRAARAHFAAEATLLGLAFGLGVLVAGLGLAPTVMSRTTFTSFYACAIGLAFLLVQVTLSLRPQLPAEVREVAQASYTTTTLAKVDCEAALARLDALMVSQQLYKDPELSLSTLAARLGLSPHQLSELLNTRLGKSFSRLLRERRIAAARTMLCEQPSASVLSVGLSVGFSSPSNFYEAFRDLEGTTPGQYRKLHRKQAAAPPPPAP